MVSGAAQVWLPELLGAASEPVAPPAAASTPSDRSAHVGRLPERSAALPALLAGSGLELPRDPVLLTTLLCLDPVAALVRLKASNADIARAAAVVTGRPEPEGSAPIQVRRWMAAVGEAADDLAMLWRLRHGTAPAWEPVMRGIRERQEPLSRKQLAITGSDLRAIGIPPGPAMGAVLDRLVAQVVDDPSLNSREVLLARARTLA
jgi:tRNA nucleotidyltransferase domain 2 putative